MTALFRYHLRVTDGTGQPHRYWPSGNNRRTAIKTRRRVVDEGPIGGSGQVVDTTVGHPDRNVVYERRRKV